MSQLIRKDIIERLKKTINTEHYDIDNSIDNSVIEDDKASQSDINSVSEPEYQEDGVNEDTAERLKELMMLKKKYKDKMTELNNVKKQLMDRTNAVDNELAELMEKAGLEEVIHGENRFIVSMTMRRKPLKADEFRSIAEVIVGDAYKIEQIYNLADEMKQTVFTKKVKCLKAHTTTK